MVMSLGFDLPLLAFQHSIFKKAENGENFLINFQWQIGDRYIFIDCALCLININIKNF